MLLDEEIRDFTIPNSEYFNDKNYIEAYWGVYQLKEIEWVSIPIEVVIERNNREESLTPKVRVQDIESLEHALTEGKNFEYERTSSGMKIYGYK